jgi:hypothetical protein
MYMKKTLLTASGIGIVLLAFGSVALAGGIGPFLVGISNSSVEIHNLIKGPEKLPALDARTGCDQSATTTNCATIKTSQPAEQAPTGLSTATSYTEVATTKQSGKIDQYLTIENTLKSVSFCGNLTLKTRQVVINGVDVGQRIAQLASNDQMGKMSDGTSFGQAVCNSMPHNIEGTKGILEMRDVTIPQTDDPRASRGGGYVVNMGTMSFVVNPLTNEIFNIDAYDGTLVSLGKLK